MPSSIAAAQDGLKAILGARNGAFVKADGTRVPITVGWPVPAPELEHVYIEDDVTDWSVQPEVSGVNAPLEERYLLSVVCWVVQTTDAYTEPRDRALAISNEVVAAVRADHTLGGAANVSDAMLEGREIRGDVRGDARGVRARVFIRVRAQLA